jgi:transcriptional regulator with XRE-family HTH domain
MQPTAPMLPGPYARLRKARFDERTAELGLDTDMAVAEHLGVAESTVNRVRNGNVIPGERFIAAAVSELGLKFEELFEIAKAS